MINLFINPAFVYQRKKEREREKGVFGSSLKNVPGVQQG